MAVLDGGFSRARSRYPYRDIAGGEQMTRGVATAEEKLLAPQGFRPSAR